MLVREKDVLVSILMLVMSFYLGCGKERANSPSGAPTNPAGPVPTSKPVTFKVRGIVANRKGAPVPKFELMAWGYDVHSKKAFVNLKEGKLTNPLAQTDTSGAFEMEINPTLIGYKEFIIKGPWGLSAPLTLASSPKTLVVFTVSLSGSPAAVAKPSVDNVVDLGRITVPE